VTEDVVDITGTQGVTAVEHIEVIEGIEATDDGSSDASNGPKKRILVVGLGMVAISFMYVVGCSGCGWCWVSNGVLTP
jgi:hypothetical protein